MRSATRLGIAVALVLAAGGAGGDASARSLQAIAERGALALCANPSALPFASKTGTVPGFQIELAEKLAERLGVALRREWVLSAFQYRRADCDVVFDAIVHRDAKPEGRLRLSRPYHRSGVVLAAQKDSGVSSLTNLPPGKPVGVQVESLVSMTLGKGGVPTTPFVLEADIMTALADRQIEAGAVTPASIGWFNLNHPDAQLRPVPVFENDPDLNWNLAVGMIRPDDKLRERLDAALEAMLADGTIARIYTRYGIELRSPQ